MLNVIEEKIAQTLDGLFSGFGCKTAAEVGKKSLQSGEEDEAERYHPDRICSDLLGDVIIDEITEKEICESF